MKKALSIAAMLSLTVFVAFAQVKNPVTTALKEIQSGRQKNIIAAAEAMPADKYSYKPTADQSTFAHLMAHTAEANYAFCGAASGDTAKKGKVSEADSKDVLSKAVKDSFAYCEAALGKVDDSNLGQTVTLFDSQTTRGAALIRMAAAWSDHYAAAAMYLRLNNLLPPSAAKLK